MASASGRVRRFFNASVAGPDHVCLYFQPCLAGGRTVITRWSLGPGTPPVLNHFNHHFAFLATGSPSQTWPFWFEIEEDASKPDECAASLGLALAGHHLEATTPALQALTGLFLPSMAWVVQRGFTHAGL